MGLKKPAHLRLTNSLHKKSKRRGKVRFQSLKIPVDCNDNNDDYSVIFTLQIRWNKTDEYSTIQQLPLRIDIPLNEVKAKIANTVGIPLRELRVYADKHRLLQKNDATLFELGIDQDTVLLVRRKDEINDSEVAKVVMGFAPESAPTKREISTQYKDLSRIYHPDKCEDDVKEEREEQFKVIGRAKEFMMEQALREESTKERPLTFHHRGMKRTIRVKSGTSISDVKEEMSKLVGVSSSEQMVLRNGRLLDENKILSEINIEEDDCLQLSAVQPVHLFVKMDSRTITLLVDSTTSIAVVKNEVAIKTAIAPGDQRLSFGSKDIWQDEFTVVDYNIQDGSTIHLLGRLRGGSNGEEKRDADEVYTPPHGTQVVSASSELSSDFSSPSSQPSSNDTSQQHNTEPPAAAVAHEHESSKRACHVNEDEECSDQKRRKTNSLPPGNANALVVVAPSAEIDLSKVTYKNYDLNPAYYEESVYSYLSRGHYQGYVPSNQLIAQPSSSNVHPTPSISRSPTAECAFSGSSVTSLAQVPTPDNDATMLSLVPLSGWYGSASIEEVIAEFEMCGCTFQPNAIYVPSLRPTVHSCCNDDSSSTHDSSSSASPHEQQQQQPSSSATRSPDTHNSKETFRSVKVKVQVEDESVDDDLVAKQGDSVIKVNLRVDNDLVTVVDDELVTKDLCAHVPTATRDRSNLSPSFTLPEPVTTGLGTERISCDEYYNTRLGLETGVQKAISATLEYDEDSKMLDCAKRYLNHQWNAHNDFVANGCKSPPSRTHPLAYHKEMGDIINATGKFISNLGEMATVFSRLLAVMHYGTMSEKGFKHSDPALMHNKLDRNSPCPSLVAKAWASATWYHTTGVYEKGEDRPEIAIIDCIPILLEKGNLSKLKEQCRAFLKEFGVLEYFEGKKVRVYDAMFVIMVPIFAHNVDQITYNNNKNPAPVVAVGGESATLFIDKCKASTPSFLGRGSTIHPDAATDGVKQFPEQTLVDSDACITAAMRDVLRADLEQIGYNVNALQCFLSWRLKLRGLSDEEILLLAESLMCTVLHNVSQAVVAVMQKGESRADVADSFGDDVLNKYNLTRRMVQIYVKLCRTHEGKAPHKVSYAVNSEMPNCPDMSRVQIAESFGEDKLKEYDLTQEMVQEYVKHMDMHKVSYAVNAEMPNCHGMSKADVAAGFNAEMRAKYGLTEEMVQKYVKHCKACEESAVKEVKDALEASSTKSDKLTRLRDLFSDLRRQITRFKVGGKTKLASFRLPTSTTAPWQGAPKSNLAILVEPDHVKEPLNATLKALLAGMETDSDFSVMDWTEIADVMYRLFDGRDLTVMEVKDALKASSTKSDKLTSLLGISAVSDLRRQITSVQVGGKTKLASIRLSVPAHWRGQGVPELQVIIVEPDDVKEPLHAAMKALLAGMETDSDFSVMDWTEIADVMYRLFDGEYLTVMEVKDALKASSTKSDKLTSLLGISAVSDLRRQITSVQVGGKTKLASFRLSVPAHWRGQGVPELQVIIVEPDDVKEPLHAAMKALLAGMETDSDFSVMDWTEIADVMYRLFDGEYLTAMEVKDALEVSSTLDGKRAKLRGLPKIVSLRQEITSFRVGGATTKASFVLPTSVTAHWKGRGAPKNGQVIIVESDNAKESERVALCALLKGMKTDSIYRGVDWGAIKNELSFLFGA